MQDILKNLSTEDLRLARAQIWETRARLERALQNNLAINQSVPTGNLVVAKYYTLLEIIEELRKAIVNLDSVLKKWEK